MIEAFVTAFIIVLFMMMFFFTIAQIKNDNSLIDIAWGLGFVVIAVFTFYKYAELSDRQVLITLLVLLWGLRLSAYILLRNWGKGEDFRYKQMRDSWGDMHQIRAFFNIFLIQTVIMMIVAIPVVLVNTDYSRPASFFDYFGLGLWCFGFIFETMADYQKYSFRKNPENRDKVLNVGLWAYSRHPNYFGETLMWWGIYFIAFSTPLCYLAVISPLTMTIMLLFVSGVPLLEKKLMENPEYIIYMEKTPMFIPSLVIKK